MGNKQVIAMLLAFSLAVSLTSTSEAADPPPWFKHPVDLGNMEEYTRKVTPKATINSISESDTTATVTTSAAHHFVVMQVVAIKGTSVSGYNGKIYKIATVPSATTFTVTATSGLGSATGGTATLMPDPSAYTSFGPLWPPIPFGGTIMPDIKVVPKTSSLPTGSWVYDWVFDPTLKVQADLLRAHEQVHFDLYALAFWECLNNVKGLSAPEQADKAKSFLSRVIELDKVYESKPSTGGHYDSPNQSLWTTQIGSLKKPGGTFSELEKWASDPARPWKKK